MAVPVDQLHTVSGSQRNQQDDGKGIKTEPSRPAGMLFAQVWGDSEILTRKVEAHVAEARRWDRVSKWSALIVTFTTGISAISFFASSALLGAVFALVSAAVAAINSSFNPPEAAKLNRDAVLRYQRLLVPLRDLEYQTDPNVTIYDATHGFRRRPPIVGNELHAAWQQYRGLQTQILEANEAAPLVDWEKWMAKAEAQRDEAFAAWQREQARRREQMAVDDRVSGAEDYSAPC